jgi:hypothetical protein
VGAGVHVDPSTWTPKMARPLRSAL